jgi:UDP-N-acetylglucosamine 1-carboxyvinyltransferase
MAAATLAEGTTTIEAAACEPEVVDLGRFLNAMGAKITGLGTPFLTIEGVEKLTGVAHTVIPDRIEAATLMMAAALTGGDVELENVLPAHVTAVIEKLREIGVEITPTDSGTIRVRRSGPLKPADVVTQPYPGLPTDVQAQFMAMLAKAEGLSIVTDKVFPDRFMHAPELVRLGASIRREGPSAIITGVKTLSGACVMASDLRASAALVIAALAAEGETVIRRIYHLDRGYERLEKKLNQLGARIKRLGDAPEHLPEALKPDGIASHAAHAEVKPPHWLHAARSKVP